MCSAFVEAIDVAYLGPILGLCDCTCSITKPSVLDLFAVLEKLVIMFNPGLFILDVLRRRDLFLAVFDIVVDLEVD
jgi:hypothetical protein